MKKKVQKKVEDISVTKDDAVKEGILKVRSIVRTLCEPLFYYHLQF